MSNGFKATPTREELLALIASDPSSLEGKQESQWLDFKRDPHLKPDGKTEPPHRFELAKDVTAMANADGGIIVWGFAEVRDTQSVRRMVGKLSPVADGIVDEGQIRDTLKEWVFPTSLEVHVFERPVDGRGSVWVLDIPRQPIARLPFLVVREWPPGKDDKQPVRGHFTMYRRSGTHNVHVPPEEIYLWLHAGYHGFGGSTAAIVPVAGDGGGGGAAPVPDRDAASIVIPTTVEEALTEELDALGVQEGDAYYFIQIMPEAGRRIPGFFGRGEEGFIRRLETFKSIRPISFGPFSPYAHPNRTASNALRLGIEGKGGVQVRDSGLATFICCQETLVWASEKHAPKGALIINPIALLEFTLEACRFFMGEVLPRASDPRGRKAFQWRVGMRGLQGPVRIYLPKGYLGPVPLRAFWEILPPHAATDFVTAMERAVEDDPSRSAFTILETVYHQFGYDPADIPYQQNGTIDCEALRSL